MPDLHDDGPCVPDRADDCDEADEVCHAVEKIAAGLRRDFHGCAALGADGGGVACDFDVVTVVADQAAVVVGTFANDWTHRAGN